MASVRPYRVIVDGVEVPGVIDCEVWPRFPRPRPRTWTRPYRVHIRCWPPFRPRDLYAAAWEESDDRVLRITDAVEIPDEPVWFTLEKGSP